MFPWPRRILTISHSPTSRNSPMAKEMLGLWVLPSPQSLGKDYWPWFLQLTGIRIPILKTSDECSHAFLTTSWSRKVCLLGARTHHPIHLVLTMIPSSQHPRALPCGPTWLGNNGTLYLKLYKVGYLEASETLQCWVPTVIVQFPLKMNWVFLSRALMFRKW